MTEVKAGDWIRVLVEEEGIVSRVLKGGCVIVNDRHYYSPVGEGNTVSIEVVRPPFQLPTKLYGQVLDAEGKLWTRVRLDSELGKPWRGLISGLVSSYMLLSHAGLRVISEGIDE